MKSVARCSGILIFFICVLIYFKSLLNVNCWHICTFVTITGQAARVRKLLLYRVVQRGRGAGEGLRLQAPLRRLQGVVVTCHTVHCPFYYLGGGRLVRPRQSHLRHHPVPDARLRGPDLAV